MTPGRLAAAGVGLVVGVGLSMAGIHVMERPISFVGLALVLNGIGLLIVSRMWELP